LAGAVVGAVRGPGVTATVEAAEQDALARFGTCLNTTGGRGDLLILIDESASLSGGQSNHPASDPDDIRVIAGNLMLDQLSAAAERNAWDGLQVAIAGFSSDYVERLPWTELPGGLAPAQQAMKRQAQLDRELETDYWHALTTATEVLTARRRVDSSDKTCQAVFWFSDGAFSLEPNVHASRVRERTGFEWAPGLDDSTAASVRAAEEAATGGTDFRSGALCKPAGVIDGLRANEIYVFAVGLSSTDSPASAFDLMTAMTEGPTERCGDQPPLGKFYAAASLEQLIEDFYHFGDPSLPPVDTGNPPVCQGTDPKKCADMGAGHAHVFTVDDSVTQLTGLAIASAPDLQLYALPPGSNPIELSGIGQTSTQGGVSIAWETLVGNKITAITIRLEQANGTDWAGEWRVLFVDPSATTANLKSSYSFRIEADIEASWELLTEPKKVQVGGEARGKISWRHKDGRVIDELAGELSLDATLFGEKAELVGSRADANLLDSGVTWSVAIPAAAPPGGTSLVLTPRYIAAGAVRPGGTPIEGTTSTFPLTIYPAPGYPAKVASEVSLGKLADGATSGSGWLEFVGPGCLWLEAATTVAEPSDATDVKWSSSADSQSNCINAAAGENGRLPISLSMQKGGNGQAVGALTVMAIPDGAGDALSYKATANATATKPIDLGITWWVTLAATGLGLGLPFLALYISKILGTTMRGTGDVMAKSFQVRLAPGGGIEGFDGRPVNPSEILSSLTGKPKGVRAIKADGWELRVTYGPSPFGLGHVRVHAPGLLGASSSHGWPEGRDQHASLPLSIAGSWAVLVDPAQAVEASPYTVGAPTGAVATLLVLASIADQARGAEATLASANARAGEVIERLVRRAQSAQAPGSPPKTNNRASKRGKARSPRKELAASNSSGFAQGPESSDGALGEIGASFERGPRPYPGYGFRSRIDAPPSPYEEQDDAFGDGRY
jgi:hypothetical protein